MRLSTAANSPQNSFSMLVIQPAGRNVDGVWLVSKDLHIPSLNDQQHYMGGWTRQLRDLRCVQVAK